MFFYNKNQELTQNTLSPGEETQIPCNLLAFAQNHPTPFYLYNLPALKARVELFKKNILPARIFYAMKANSHPDILKLFHNEGVDVVSGGEIDLAVKAGFRGDQILFSGVGKTRLEIQNALQHNILQFHVESVPELVRIQKTAKSMGVSARVAFRLNPDVKVLHSHPYIQTGLREHKFGIELNKIPELKHILKSARGELTLTGLSFHIGSQIKDLGAIQASINKISEVYLELQKEFPSLSNLDVGGGLGVNYQSTDDKAEVKLITEYGNMLSSLSKKIKGNIFTEPGRILTARYGCLISRVQYIKKTSRATFAILDTGMHHLIRPCLYQSQHTILPLLKRPGEKIVYDIVGPICESSDIFAKHLPLTPLKEDDYVAILDTGAYGYVMASTYNQHPLPKQYCIKEGHLIS